MREYFYIQTNPDWINKYKFGYTKNLTRRLFDNFTQHSSMVKYHKIYEIEKLGHYKLYPEFDKIFSIVCRNKNMLDQLSSNYSHAFTNLNSIVEYLIEEGGGREFINGTCLDVIHNVIMRDEFEMLGVKCIKEFTEEEIKLENKKVRERIDNLHREREERFWDNFKKKNKVTWNPRPYQQEIIEKSIQELQYNHKIYIELATGGGKSFIVFNILKFFKPEVIVIFSPRKKINEQNMDDKYLSLLDDEYAVFNMSSNKDPNRFFSKLGKKIIICCSQSSKRLHEYIFKYQTNFQNVMVWYDETHWGFGEWLNEENIKNYEVDTKGNSIQYRKFWLEDESIITKRVYVSASPNHEQKKKNKKIFGKLVNHIKVNELIKQKWLCPIIPYVFEMDKKKDEVQILKYIFEDFKREKRKWGFSFHSKQTYAFSLFYYHFQEYYNKKTDIRPFILIGDDFYDILKKTDEELEMIKINEKKDGREITRYYTEQEIEDIILVRGHYNLVKKQIKDNHDLDYEFQNIKTYQKNSNSMGYVVQKYSMGYDFKDIDYIIFADPKTASKDIIQCIGRGTRSDKLGEDGRNLHKNLKFYMPVYYEHNQEDEDIEDNKKYHFRNVIKVLRYLILDLQLKLDELTDRGFSNNQGVKKMNIFVDGNEKMKSKLFDLLYGDKILRPMDLRKLVEFCIRNNILTEKDYNKFKLDRNIRLKENLYDYTGFFWQKVVDPEKRKFYPCLQECEEAKQNIKRHISQELSENKKELKLRLRKIKNNAWLELKKYDSKIPPFRDLERFYPK